MLAVDVEACLVRVGVVKAQRHERVHDAFDEPLVDHGAVSLVLDQMEDRNGEFGLISLDGDEKVVFPLYEGELQKTS